MSRDVETYDAGNAMIIQRESTHQLDTLYSGGSAGTGVVFTATGEFG